MVRGVSAGEARSTTARRRHRRRLHRARARRARRPGGLGTSLDVGCVRDHRAVPSLRPALARELAAAAGVREVTPPPLDAGQRSASPAPSRRSPRSTSATSSTTRGGPTAAGSRVRGRARARAARGDDALGAPPRAGPRARASPGDRRGPRHPAGGPRPYDLQEIEVSERDILHGAASRRPSSPSPKRALRRPGAYTCCLRATRPRPGRAGRRARRRSPPPPASRRRRRTARARAAHRPARRRCRTVPARGRLRYSPRRPSSSPRASATAALAVGPRKRASPLVPFPRGTPRRARGHPPETAIRTGTARAKERASGRSRGEPIQLGQMLDDVVVPPGADADERRHREARHKTCGSPLLRAAGTSAATWARPRRDGRDARRSRPGQRRRPRAAREHVANRPGEDFARLRSACPSRPRRGRDTADAQRAATSQGR